MEVLCSAALCSAEAGLSWTLLRFMSCHTLHLLSAGLSACACGSHCLLAYNYGFVSVLCPSTVHRGPCVHPLLLWLHAQLPDREGESGCTVALRACDDDAQECPMKELRAGDIGEEKSSAPLSPLQSSVAPGMV